MQKQTIVIAGGTGLVGQALLRHIDRTKYDIIILSRDAKSATDGVSYAQWNTKAKTIDLNTQVDHIINLAGAGIADERWSRSRKKELIDSRVHSAQTLAKYISTSGTKPQTYISASAIGYYGDRGSEILTEMSPMGSGFMVDCCKKWEDAGYETGLLCQRHAILRIGIVLSKFDGALPKMVMTKGLGIYNYFGDGSQYYSWIHIDDLCRMIMYTIENPQVKGIYNACAPTSFTNKDFMREVMKGLGSKGLLIGAPSIALNIAMGEMAAVVLNSNRVSAERVLKSGFVFEYGELAEAVEDVFKRDV